MTLGVGRHGAELQLHPGGAVTDSQLWPGHQTGGQQTGTWHTLWNAWAVSQHIDNSKNTQAWAVSQHVGTSKNTKVWAVSQHIDTSKNTQAWAVPQCTGTSKNTKATLKCCLGLRSTSDADPVCMGMVFLMPSTFSELLHLYTPSQQLCSSADTQVFWTPSFQTKSSGQHSFSYQAQAVLSQLPVSVCHSTSVSSFKSSMKPFLFQKPFLQSHSPDIRLCVCVCVCVCVCCMCWILKICTFKECVSS